MKDRALKAIILTSVVSILMTSAPNIYAEEEGKASLGDWAAYKASEEAEDTETAGETEDSPLLGAASDGEVTKLTSYGLPVLSITLSGTTLDTINSGSKTIKYEGNTVSITDESDPSYDLSVSGVEIKGHGNSTWQTDKKPYQIKFSKKTSLLGLPAAKKYILLANAFDPSGMRDAVASDLAQGMGLPACLYRFIDLYVDGRYIGNYMLSQKAEASVAGLTETDGLLMEIDNIHWNDTNPLVAEEPDPYFESALTKTHVSLKDSVSSDESTLSVAMDSFETSFESLEKAAKAGDWTAVQSLSDVKSLAEYYLLQEFSANPDGCSSSFYLYKNGSSDIIHAGPAWDFDLAFNSIKPRQGDAFKDAGRLWIYNDHDVIDGTDLDAPILTYLMDIPEFRALVGEIWQGQLKALAEKEVSAIGSMQAEIASSMDANASVWGNDYASDTTTLLNWFDSRSAYFDRVFGEKDAQLTEGNVTIASSGGTVLGIADRSTSDSGNVELETEKGLPTQNFILHHLTEEFYTIENRSTGKYLDVTGAQTKKGTNIQQYSYNGTEAQQWQILDNGDGTYTFLSRATGMALDAAGGHTAEGTNIQLWSSNGTAAQKYSITYTNSTPVDTSKIYTLVSKLDGNMAADISGASMLSGANLQLWTSNGTGAQKFSFKLNSDGYYTILNAGSGKAIDVSGGSHAAAANIWQWDLNGTGAQKWAIQVQADGSVTFINAGSGKVMDVSGGQTRNGTNIQQWDYNGTNAQKWVLKTV